MFIEWPQKGFTLVWNNELLRRQRSLYFWATVATTGLDGGSLWTEEKDPGIYNELCWPTQCHSKGHFRPLSSLFFPFQPFSQ